MVIAIAAAAGPSRAEDYPSKPIRLIVVTAAGGLMDVAARVLADSLDKSLGQRLVIEIDVAGVKDGAPFRAH